MAFVKEPEPVVVEPVAEPVVEPEPVVVVEPRRNRACRRAPARSSSPSRLSSSSPSPSQSSMRRARARRRVEPVVAEAAAREPSRRGAASETTPELIMEAQPVPSWSPDLFAAEAAREAESVLEESEPAGDEQRQPEAEPPTLVVLPEPRGDAVPEPEPSAAHAFTVLDSPTLPDYVIDEPDEIAARRRPRSRSPSPTCPGLSRSSSSSPSGDAPAAPPARVEPEPEEEEDLGPLPDYVIDPSDPRPVRPAPPPPEPEPRAVFEALAVRAEGRGDPVAGGRRLLPAGDGFPDAACRRRDEGTRESRRFARPRPAADTGKPKRPTEPAEPGDEAGEVNWMEGLSNRLSAYSLSEDEPPTAADSDDDETT